MHSAVESCRSEGQVLGVCSCIQAASAGKVGVRAGAEELLDGDLRLLDQGRDPMFL